ncbi:hypothetical protein B0A52_01156 [Exophiala mesophila]|uniref:2-dehydropantoate 2-reductase n=1 Tax=Exophiala mesophila TaxID=212818 RepID=A0A438NGM2_EXOME|nr:hypothetical protein B0A52_01156 [Exophiala mesophila]
MARAKPVRLSVVARSNYDAVKKNGVTISSMNHGRHHFAPFQVLKTPAEAGQKFDFVVLANKAIDVTSVPDRIAPVVEEGKTTIVLIQNGVGNEDPFRKAYPKNVILSCVTWVGAVQHSPGVVEHKASEHTHIGIFPGPEVDPALEKEKLIEFTDIWQEGGTPFTIQDNIQIQRWEKVVWNVAWNALTTLTMLDTHSWLSSSDRSTPMTKTLMQEVISVARAAGVPLEDSLTDSLIERILAMPTIGSSMQVDCKMGRVMEVDIILGTPVRKGKELGIPTPTLDVLYTLLLAVNSRMQ